jgi:phage shock protein PspC (stress-responsive transcriptional regulator)
MDKPPPYRRSMPPDYEPPRREPDILYQDSNRVSGVIGGVLAAYRINPIMIAMIVLLLTILGALGYYMLRNDDRIYAYIALRDKRESDLYDRLVDMALKCKDKPTDKSESYPTPMFPNLFTGGQSFRYGKENNK